jgi:hypothetical protein
MRDSGTTKYCESLGTALRNQDFTSPKPVMAPMASTMGVSSVWFMTRQLLKSATELDQAGGLVVHGVSHCGRSLEC